MENRPDSQTAPSAAAEYDRRRQPRFQTKVPAELVTSAPGSQPLKTSVVEMSQTGLRVLVPSCLDEGTEVFVRLKDVVITGHVRHCRAIRGAFTAGIEVSDVSGPDQYDHLGDLELDLYAMVVQVVRMRATCEPRLMA